MRKTNNGRRGGLLKGKSHDNGGMPVIVTGDNNRPIEVEGGEIIINKKSVASNKEFRLKGTAKQILSSINSDSGNGVAIGHSQAEVFKFGGEIKSYSGYMLNYLKWWK